MTKDDDFRVRPGRIRSRSGAEPGTALRQVRIAVIRAGGHGRGLGAVPGKLRPSLFGRGRIALARDLSAGGPRRTVVVKARVARRTPGGLGAHLAYLQRDGVTRDGEPGRLFDARSDAADGSAFAARAGDDRHHFRFIVSPEDAAELSDLRAYAHDLLGAVERDLGAPLDWVAVDHWNTAHPHLHIVLRGRLEDGADLVISRDYISRGLRERAEALATLELGPPSARDRAAALARDAEAGRWTRLDRMLERRTDGRRRVDLRPGDGRDPVFTGLLVRRAAVLQGLGLAEPDGAGRWRLQPDLRSRLDVLAREGEVIARLADAVKARGLARGPEHWTTAPIHGPPAATVSVPSPSSSASPSPALTGRVLARGQDDELRGAGFAVIDGMDGRVHHITLADVGAADPRVDAIVRVGPLSRSGHPMTTTVSDLDLKAQVGATGATWLDRRLLSPHPVGSAGGFADEVAAACEARLNHLVAEGLAERRDGRVRFAPHMLETLKARDLGAAAARIQSETGRPCRPAEEGETVSGVYRRRLDLASGRFALIDDGLGFSLAPWRAPLERSLGRKVDGLAGPGGDIDWRPPRTLGR